MAYIHELERQIKTTGTKLDCIEVGVEFFTGESERCAFNDKERVYAWFERFR